MLELDRNIVAKMPPDMQRLVGYSTTIEGLGFVSLGLPAKLLGDGGRALLREDMANMRPAAVSNYKRLLGHLDEHTQRSKEPVDVPTNFSRHELEQELEALKKRSHTISNRMHDLESILSRL